MNNSITSMTPISFHEWPIHCLNNITLLTSVQTKYHNSEKKKELILNFNHMLEEINNLHYKKFKNSAVKRTIKRFFLLTTFIKKTGVRKSKHNNYIKMIQIYLNIGYSYNFNTF